jgi:hypothetical protein
MENKISCSIKEPHSHLVHGMTFECEKGQDIGKEKMIKIKGYGCKKQNAFKQIGTQFGNAIRKLGER